MSRNSPFTRNFWALKDLAKELVKYMPRTYKYPNEAEDEVAAPTSDDVCESGDEEKSSPSSRDSIRQVVDVAQGILTGSPKDDEAVVFPSVQSHPNEGASEDIVSDIRRGALERFLDERYQTSRSSNLFVEPLKRWEDRKCLPELVRLWLYRKQRTLQGRWYDKGNISVDGDKAAAARSLPPA
ncbi:hypothetical protein PsorP6_014071 [Peronosclerospora sorghi]|uniref:Uncharacterized protein n=1 Tax=Peronosclerospora sorghi TaxID=230839 RepID=A0ACC0VJ03_9STRA|nr:hypothetical protein PsorP6_014071 [Peronosclerospora sorghi]